MGAALPKLPTTKRRVSPALIHTPPHPHPHPPKSAGLLNASAVLALGGGTGPAMNPARDLMPRLAFHLLPIPGKGCSE